MKASMIPFSGIFLWIVALNLATLALSVSFPVFNGYQTVELSGTTIDQFNLELDNWNAVGLVSTNKSSSCGTYPVLGGYGILGSGGYFQRDYTNLPTHSVIYYQVRFFILDNWILFDSFTLQINGQSIPAQNLLVVKLMANNSTCGDPSANDLINYVIVGTMPHTATTVSLEVISNINRAPTVASLGIRDVSLTFANPSVIPAQSFCYRISDTIVYGMINECKCIRGQYQNPSNIFQCLSCSTSCAECYGPSASECLVCAPGYSFVGTQCIKCDSTCSTCSGTSGNQCITCQNGLWLYPNNTCLSSCNYPFKSVTPTDNYKVCQYPCQTNEYLLWDNTCVSSCTAPLVSATAENITFCNKPCTSGQYLSWDNITCLSTCDPPLVNSTQQNVSLCNLPCSSNQFLYPSNTCLPTCDWPWVNKTVGVVNTCNQPCQSNEFLYPDNTCKTACPLPWVNQTVANITICKTPCPSNEFLYWDNTCRDNCSYPYKNTTIENIQVCNLPCTNSSDFLYPDQTCLPTCPSPMIEKNLTDVKLCNSPCQSNQYFYLNTTCIGQCDPPFTIEQITGLPVNICHHPCANSSDYFYVQENFCSPTCGAPNQTQEEPYIKYCYQYVEDTVNYGDKEKVIQVAEASNTIGEITSVGMSLVSIVYSSSPSSFTIASLFKMLQYIRYMSINYSPRLEIMLENQKPNSLTLSFSTNLPMPIQNEIPTYPIPAKFKQYGLHSSFIVNFWGPLITLAVIIVIICICLIAIPLIRRHKYAYSFFYWIRLVTKWDFLILVFCTNFDGIGMFSSLELRNLSSDSIFCILSAIICIIMNLIAITILAKAAYIVRDLQKQKGKVATYTPAKNETKSHTKWDDYHILYKNFKPQSFTHQGFMFFAMLRIYIFHIIIGYMFQYPLVQSILITILSLFMLSYMALKRPFNKRFDLAQAVINEGIILIVNANVMTLAIMDNSNKEATNSRITIGDVIIILNILFNVTTLIFVITELAIGFHRVYKQVKVSKTRGIGAWLQVLLVLFEQDALALSEKRVPQHTITQVTDPERQVTETGVTEDSLIRHNKQPSVHTLETEGDATPTLTPRRKRIQLRLKTLESKDFPVAEPAIVSPVSTDHSSLIPSKFGGFFGKASAEKELLQNEDDSGNQSGISSETLSVIKIKDGEGTPRSNSHRQKISATTPTKKSQFHAFTRLNTMRSAREESDNRNDSFATKPEQTDGQEVSFGETERFKTVLPDNKQVEINTGDSDENKVELKNEFNLDPFFPDGAEQCQPNLLISKSFTQKTMRQFDRSKSNFIDMTLSQSIIQSKLSWTNDVEQPIKKSARHLDRSRTTFVADKRLSIESDLELRQPEPDSLSSEVDERRRRLRSEIKRLTTDVSKKEAPQLDQVEEIQISELDIQ